MTSPPDSLDGWLDGCAAPALAEALRAMAGACASIASTLSRASLGEMHGEEATANPHGETQKTLDLVCDRTIGAALERCASVAAWASEERAVPVVSERHGASGEYLVAVDPLDGSASAVSNGAVGTIFSVHRHPTRGTTPGEAGFLQPGRRQCAAGYAIYGPETLLVVACGDALATFARDGRAGCWRAVDRTACVPAETRILSINVSNQRFWEKPVQRYVAECLAGTDGPRAVEFNMRWIGCMVAEVHRLVTQGGVYLYPRDARVPRRAGRLRLLYEAAPMAYIVERAGGMAVTGTQPLLDVVPDTLHQTVPVILGARGEVERIVAYHAEPHENLHWPLFKERSLFVTPTR